MMSVYKGVAYWTQTSEVTVQVWLIKREYESGFINWEASINKLQKKKKKTTDDLTNAAFAILFLGLAIRKKAQLQYFKID